MSGTVFMLSGSASADCSRPIRGEWQIYISFPQDWVRCSLNVGRDGSLETGSTCGGRRLTRSTVKGTLTASESCGVTAQLSVRGTLYRLVDGFFNVDGTQLTGPVLSTKGTIGSLTAHRQR